MKSILLPLFIGILIAGPSHARIGETFAECEARYGPSSEPRTSDGRAAFMKDNVMINAYFKSGKVERISFHRLDYSTNPVNPEFQDLFPVEIFTLLARNSGGRKWQVLNGDLAPVQLQWETTDNQFLANYRDKTLSIYSRDAWQSVVARLMSKDWMSGF